MRMRNYEKKSWKYRVLIWLAVNFTIIFSGLILADMERMMTPAAALLEAVSAQDFFVVRTRTNPEPETGKFKLIFVVWIFARFLKTNSRSRSTKKIRETVKHTRLLFSGTLLMTKDPETKRNRIGSRLWTLRIVQEVLWAVVLDWQTLPGLFKG